MFFHLLGNIAILNELLESKPIHFSINIQRKDVNNSTTRINKEVLKVVFMKIILDLNTIEYFLWSICRKNLTFFVNIITDHSIEILLCDIMGKRVYIIQYSSFVFAIIVGVYGP